MFDEADRKFISTWVIRVFGAGFVVVSGAGMLGLAAGIGIRTFELVTR